MKHAAIASLAEYKLALELICLGWETIGLGVSPHLQDSRQMAGVLHKNVKPYVRPAGVVSRAQEYCRMVQDYVLRDAIGAVRDAGVAVEVEVVCLGYTHPDTFRKAPPEVSRDGNRV